MSTLEIGAIVTLFVITWFVTGFLVSAIGGWWELGEHYRTQHAPPLHVSRWKSGRMGGLTNYNNVLTIGADPHGLFLHMPKLFRVGHPDLFIPWTDIAAEPRRRLFGPRVRLNFTRTKGVYLELREELAGELLHAGGQSTAPHGHRAYAQ